VEGIEIDKESLAYLGEIRERIFYPRTNWPVLLFALLSALLSALLYRWRASR
jgi:hypothetical protein